METPDVTQNPEEENPRIITDTSDAAFEQAKAIEVRQRSLGGAESPEKKVSSGELSTAERAREKSRREADREASLAKMREEVNAMSESQSRENQRGPDSDHPNPFWKEQEELLTGWDRFTERILGGGEKAYQKIGNFLQPLRFHENPDRARKNQDKYDKLVENGEAEYVGENPRVSYPDYMLMKRAYEKRGNFRDYYFRSVGIYNEKGKFTGTVRTYRIKKRGR